jgi:hypothetical protein
MGLPRCAGEDLGSFHCLALHRLSLCVNSYLSTKLLGAPSHSRGV